MIEKPTPPPEPQARRVSVLLYPGVELLDFAGPGEVFAVAGELAVQDGARGYGVRTVALEAGPIISQGFLEVIPDAVFDTERAPDVLVIPGGEPRALTDHAGFMAWLERALEEAEIVMSVCTGAFALAHVGALDGLDATTWHGRLEDLARAAPRARIVRNQRVVDAGRVVTTGGVSAGIDGALHVVARLSGHALAARTARYIEYRWDALETGA